MALIAFVSCKGAPGCTTAALAHAAVWPRPVVVAELDPAGGDLAARFHLGARRGIVSLAAAIPSDGGPVELAAHGQLLPGGLPVLVGPDSWEQAAVTVPQVVSVLRADGAADVVADCGRVTPGSPALAAVRSSDAVVAVARPVATDVYAAIRWLHSLHHPLALLALCGAGPHADSGRELAARWGLEVVSLPADRRAAAMLEGGHPLGAASRLPLFNHARAIAARLTRDLEPFPVELSGSDAFPAEGERRRHVWQRRGTVEAGS